MAARFLAIRTQSLGFLSAKQNHRHFSKSIRLWESESILNPIATCRGFSTVTELPPHNKIKVPSFGSKGKVLEWHKSVGDKVSEGGILVDVSFDDFDVEIVSEHNGYLAAITATSASGDLDDGTDLGVIVSDIDYVPFFTPNFTVPVVTSSIADDTIADSSLNNEATSTGTTETTTTIESYSNQKETSTEETKESSTTKDIETGELSKHVEEVKEQVKEQVSISGMQMLLEIKRIAKNALDKESPIPEDTLRALKELAVAENDVLKNCFFAASDLCDEAGALGPLNDEEFLEYATPLVAKHVSQKAETVSV